VGAQVVLTGTSLDQVTGVSLGNVNAAFVHDSPTQLTATVPAGAAQYPTVRWRIHWAGGGVALHDTPFAISANAPSAPVISSFAPGMGPTGSAVVLTGSNFTGASSVTLNFRPATFTVDSPTQITASVPTEVPFGSGRWRVTNADGTGAHGTVFYVAQTFAEPLGDVTLADDLGQVGVHDDPSSGVVTFYVNETLGRPEPRLVLYVYLDTDRNAGTGQVGFDRRIQIGGDGVPRMRGWNGVAYNTVLPGSTMTSVWQGRVEVKVNRSELGASGSGFDFAVVTELWDEPNQTGDHFDDRAPNSPAHAWSYDFGSA
jgi:hypothetical protein